MTPIECCIDCTAELVIGDNWTESYKANSKYHCLHCANIRNSRRMYVNGEYVSMKHPLWKPGRYTMENFGDAKVEDDKHPRGYIYIMSNPAWPTWVKVGKAEDITARLNSYQTGSPYRDFYMEYTFEVEDRHHAEKIAHNKLRRKFYQDKEWFECTPDQAFDVIRTIPHVGGSNAQTDH